MDLDTLTQTLRSRKIKGSLAAQHGRLYWRCTATDGAGVRKSRRIPLGLAAEPQHLLEAESRVVTLAAALSRQGVLPDPLPWEEPAAKVEATGLRETSGQFQKATTVADAIEQLRADFWTGRVRTSAAERTWDRISTELKRLPEGARLTTELLVATAAGTTPGSRTRLEACKVYKRLGKLAGLEGLERLDALRTHYEPGERKLPTDQVLLELLDAVRSHPTWGWATAALVVYGCRPSEVFSLQPAGDRTAKVLTVKRREKLPTWRTTLGLPPAWIERFELQAVARPWEVSSPSGYDSLEAKRLTQRWGKWLQRQPGGMQLYDVRHAWAVRSIRLGLNASLAAKAMGHSLAVHHATYHQWLEQADVAAVAAGL